MCNAHTPRRMQFIGLRVQFGVQLRVQLRVQLIELEPAPLLEKSGKPLR